MKLLRFAARYSFIVTIISVIVFAVPAIAVPQQLPNTWYVTLLGDNGNNCLSSAMPCGTINGAIEKASSGDTIYVASGTYTGSVGSEVVLINKNIVLSGGWNLAFTSHEDFSVITGGQGPYVSG